jgi:Uma2 family endonuclease
MATVPSSPQFMPPALGDPAWDIALLYPGQGYWSEEEYLSVTDNTNQLVEFTDGFIEVLAMPTIEHQLILKFLLKSLESFTEPRGLGVVLFSPVRVWTRHNQYREPDLVFNFSKKHDLSGRRYYKGADLVMEVVSDDEKSRHLDYKTKVADYALAGIPEYWIVDPKEAKITVLTLQGGNYVAKGPYLRGEVASSALLQGFSLPVSDVFNAGKR